ncbi:MAG: hypothetical protein K2H66_03065, partial [Oscillospiraceae bacterium]|nr:hypothetical protein [Oscillospiraceae bacterium]
MDMPFEPNEGKSLTIDTDFGKYARYPIKTHVITKDDILEDVMDGAEYSIDAVVWNGTLTIT